MFKTAHYWTPSWGIWIRFYLRKWCHSPRLSDI